MSNIVETFAIILTIIISTSIIVWVINKNRGLDVNYNNLIEINSTNVSKSKAGNAGNAGKAGNAGNAGGAKPSDKCTTTCDALDPVSDPRYNMQQIIKQSILLEEHLTNKNKRCRDCITKHFLHIIGLAEEAEMLATNQIEKYPLIKESVVLYNELFKIWIKNKNLNNNNDDYILYCTDKLRNHRKQLIVLYFFNEKYMIKTDNPESHQG
jgi:hypothetical protein